jgi:hypothetical protein
MDMCLFFYVCLCVLALTLVKVPLVVGVIRLVNVYWLDRYEGGCLPPMLAGREKWNPRQGESLHKRHRGAIQADGDVDMGLADELQKLDQLRRDGVLSDAEFAQAKARLLAGEAAPADPSLGQHLADQLAEVRYQNELARIDREWEMERERYLIRGRYGRRDVPTTAMAVGIGLVSGIGGLLWLVMAVAITGSAPDVGPFLIAKYVFPLFGVAFIIGGIAWAFHVYSQAQKYQAAYKTHQDRKASVMAEQFRG